MAFVRPNSLRSFPPRFRAKDLVEVAIAEEGFVGSYYEATVVAPLPNNAYLVEYATLVTDDLSAAPLREEVSAAEIRPRAPVIKRLDSNEYCLYDVVDAFDNDGWWMGTITGGAGGKYTVFFEATGDAIVYPKNRLRLHQDWINGGWWMITRAV